MKTFVGIGCFLLLSTLCCSQTQGGIGTIHVRKSKTSKSVANPIPLDNEAEFPGAQEGLSAHIKKNFHYPPAAMAENVSGTVILRLKISAEGKIAGVTVIQKVGGGCDEEAERIVRLMPDWKPARKNGKAIESNVELPFVFKIK
jgi:TonB family protein